MGTKDCEPQDHATNKRKTKEDSLKSGAISKRREEDVVERKNEDEEKEDSEDHPQKAKIR